MGNINIWKAYYQPTEKPLTYNDALGNFLFFLEKENNIKHNIEDISLKNLSNDADITNFKEIIPNNIHISEFSVHPPDTNSDPYHVTPQFSSKFVQIGKKFENEGNYKGAFEFYEVSQLQGIKDLSRMLFKTKNWITLRFYLEILLLFYPNDEEVFRMAAICYERVNEVEKALEIYNKYQSQSDFMKIGFYRLSQHISRDKSSYILAVNKIVTNPGIYDPFMLEQIIRLSLHFKKIEFGINCCFRNVKTIKFLSLFTKNAVFYEQVIDYTTKYLSIDYRAAIQTIFILYKHGDRNAAFDIAYSIRPKKKGGVMLMQRFYPLMFMLFTTGRYEEMVTRFAKFFSIFASFSKHELHFFEFPNSKTSMDHYEDFTFYKLISRIQNLPEFKQKFDFNIELSEDCDKQSYQRLTHIIESHYFPYHEHPDFIGVDDNFCEELNKLYKYDEKIAFFSILIILCAYLFIKGHFKECEDIIINTDLLIKLFLLSTNKLHHQIKFDDEIIQLFSIVQYSIFAHKDIALTESTGKVYVIGDEYSNLLAFDKFNRSAIVNQFIPQFIPGLTLWDLRPNDVITTSNGKRKNYPSPSVAFIKKLNWRKMAFYDRIDELIEKHSFSTSGIMFMIGTHDCEKIIPKYTNNLVY